MGGKIIARFSPPPLSTSFHAQRTKGEMGGDATVANDALSEIVMVVCWLEKKRWQIDGLKNFSLKLV